MKQTLEQEQIKNEIPEADLWRAVIDQAIDDLSQPKLHRAAVEWLASTGHGPGSFRWACDHLDLNPTAVWGALNKANDLERKLSTLESDSARRRSLAIIRINGE